MAGFWEFAGGKVEDGESDGQALVREIREELRLDVDVGARVGQDIPLRDTGVLRIYLCTVLGGGEPALVDHDAHRWLTPDELFDVPWLPVDLPVVQAVHEHLRLPGRPPGARTGTSGDGSATASRPSPNR